MKIKRFFESDQLDISTERITEIQELIKKVAPIMIK